MNWKVKKITKAKVGAVLLAEAYLGDTHFDQSVVLLTEHSEEGSFGFVLNKTIGIDLQDIFPEINAFDMPIYQGGPVEKDHLFYVHTKGSLVPNSMRINDQLSWGGDFQVLKDSIELGLIKIDEIRFYLGYSGWGKGQLQSELKSKSWIVLDLKEGGVLPAIGEEVSLWNELMREAGGNHVLWANIPANPQLN